MAAQKTVVNPAEFERIVMLPENADRLLELIDGEIIAKISNGYLSSLGAQIAAYLGQYVYLNKLGFVTGADGGYRLGNECYLPTCAFISRQKQPKTSLEVYNLTPPDLVVKILLPLRAIEEMAIKVDNYLRAGVVVWVVNADLQRVTVHRPDAAPKVFGIDETLDGGRILPGFSLPVRDIFAE
jgi:Uma2 family endonuclease